MQFDRVTDFVDSLRSVGIPGADIAVYIGGDEVYRHHMGYANIEERKQIAPDTLYAVWSMTKVVTCVSALRLYEKGLFLLTDPVHDYLPEFAKLSPIRIMDLFTMSSGFSYAPPPRLEELIKSTGNNFTISEFITAMSEGPLEFEPGTHYAYGYSHDILAGVIEALSGKTLGQFMRDEIFAPLGMNDTYFRVPLDQQHRVAVCYYFNEQTREHSISDAGRDPLGSLDPQQKYESGGGGLVSTTDDFGKFANALCFGGKAKNGYNLLSKNTIDLMRMNHLCETRLKEFKGMDNCGYSYGLGVRTLINPAEGGNNSTLGNFGWSGLLGSTFSVDPEIGLSYVYMQQLSPSKEPYVQPRLRNVIYACL